MSNLNDKNIVGKLTPAAGAFRKLCVDDDGVRSIGLEPRLSKCVIYGGDKARVAAEAAKLRIAYQLDSSALKGHRCGRAAVARAAAECTLRCFQGITGYTVKCVKARGAGTHIASSGPEA